jgi:hypothetical protein
VEAVASRRNKEWRAVDMAITVHALLTAVWIGESRIEVQQRDRTSSCLARSVTLGLTASSMPASHGSLWSLFLRTNWQGRPRRSHSSLNA